jgi:Protein of unknown function (DUF2911)
MKTGFFVVALLLGVVAADGLAQIRASERSTVTQTVDGTTLTVDYARPRIRGRKAVFGEEVHWGEVWTPGANIATTLEINKDIRINGHAVPKGKYSIWMTVAKGDWTLLLDTTVARFHTDRPKPEEAAIRFDIKPQHRPRIEVLTFTFPEVRSDGAVLAMQWDTVYVPLDIKVESSYPLTVAADVARPIIGSYEMRWAPPPMDTTAPDSASADSTKGHEAEGHHEGESDTPGGDGPMKLEVTFNRGSLWAKVDPPPFPGYDTMVLLPVKDDWFIPAWWKDGELYDASDEMIMEFTIENGKASGFDLRTKDDTVVATAKRVGG